MRPDTFVTGPAAIRHLDIINSHEGMTRDLSPLFQCLITKSVCCLHKGQDFNPHRGYRFVIGQVVTFSGDDTKTFIVYVCYLCPPSARARVPGGVLRPHFLPSPGNTPRPGLAHTYRMYLCETLHLYASIIQR